MCQLIIALDVDNSPQALTLMDQTLGRCSLYKIGWRFFFSQGVRGIYQLMARFPTARFLFDTKFWDTPHTIIDTVTMLETISAISMYTVALDSVQAASHVQRTTSFDRRKRILAVHRLTSDVHSINMRDVLVGKTRGAQGIICPAAQSSEIRRKLIERPSVIKHDYIICPGLRVMADPHADHVEPVLLKDVRNYPEVDFWVVGRPIINHSDPGKMAETFARELSRK